MYDKPSAPAKPITHQNMILADLNAFGNKVGVYSNHATAFEAMRGLHTSPNDVAFIEEINLRKKLLREIIGAEIDSTKGLAKPKEPVRFTHKMPPLPPDASPEEKNIKYFHDALVIEKKPYFFRYLYPELNQIYKKYEASYNEASKCMFRTKFKKLLAKPNKTDAEKALINKYHKFLPLINTNCTMNKVCREFENIDFDIKYDKNSQSLLPYHDLETFSVNESILKEFRIMYQRFCNKKILSFVNEVYQTSTDDELKEIRFGMLDAIRDELKQKVTDLGLDTLTILTYIKVLSLSYAKFNWGFAWDLLGELILEVIPPGDTVIPVENASGAEYLGRHYVLQNIPKEKAQYTVDLETGEVMLIE